MLAILRSNNFGEIIKRTTTICLVFRTNGFHIRKEITLYLFNFGFTNPKAIMKSISNVMFFFVFF